MEFRPVDTPQACVYMLLVCVCALGGDVGVFNA